MNQKKLLQTKIIVGIGVAVEILFYKNTSPLFLKILFVGLALSYAAGHFEVYPIGTLSYLLFGGLSFLFSLWSLIYTKWLSLILGCFSSLSFLSMALSFPYAVELELAMIIPVTFYLIALFDFKKHKRQLSILIVLAFYCLSEFVSIKF